MKKLFSRKQNIYKDIFNTSDIILDIQTSTRFWKTSVLLEASIIAVESDYASETGFQTEKESDEYDILIELSSLLGGYEHIYTFNGRSFDIPHLKKKYSAYRTGSPFEKMSHTDLYSELRKYDSFFPITSHRLRDYYMLVNGNRLPDSEAWAIYEILPLLRIRDFLTGAFEVGEIRYDDTEHKAEFILTCNLPCNIRCISDFFTITGEGKEAVISVRTEEGNMRMYHKDYRNYVYLPKEGYAVHKSIGAYIASSRKTAAEKNNCYTYVAFNENLTADSDKVKRYLLSVLEYLTGE